MKLNIANPKTGCQKTIEIEDQRMLNAFYDQRISAEIDADVLGEEWKGYILKITGGHDKQGFPMMQGVLVPHRVRLLLDGNNGFYKPSRKGERRRRSVRGCIVGPDISVVHLVIVKKGPGEIEGLTDKTVPSRLGPKRANNIRKLFGLTKDDDVRKYVVTYKRETKEVEKDGKKVKQYKCPKIQRLVTPLTQQRQRRRKAINKQRREKSEEQAAKYAKMLAQRRAELKEKRSQMISKQRASQVAKKA